MSRVGFIGLGSQGGPMAERIVAAGMPLTVWARRAEALEPFVARGAKAADSVAALGAACDHVGLCVVNDAGVLAICDTLVSVMAPGSCIVIHATVSPETCIAIADKAQAKGIAVLDAPVSGGGTAAAAGTLTVMCGGEAAVFDAAKPVFETFGGLIVRLGPLGAGQRAKIVNNALMAANMGLAHAAMAAGEALGVDRMAFAELVKVSSGRSFGFDVFARLPAPQSFAHGAPLLLKDVNLLHAILPQHDGADMLRAAATPFLSAATSG